MRVGFIGVGKMGSPMALRLAGAGHDVMIHDQSQEALAALAGTKGITVAPTASDAVRDVDMTITMLPDGKAVRAVADALAGALPKGSVLVDMSTSFPIETTDLGAALPDGVDMVDAPVSGGVWRAEIGTLTIMAGGRPEVLDRVEDALSAMGNVVRTGDLGSGHAMKLLNNYLSASGLAAACEAVRVGRAFGLDPDVMADVFNGSTGKNNATEVKLKQHVNNEAYASGFTMGLMAKDLTLGRQLAADLGVTARGLDTMQELYAKARDTLGSDSDHTEVMKLLQQD